MSFKEKVKQLKSYLITIYLVLGHPKTPVVAKVVIYITLAYALSPIDLIPDFIPILGLLDDLVLIPLGVFIAMKLVPRDVWDTCYQDSLTMSKNEIRFSSKAGLTAVVVTWLAILIALWSYLGG